MQESNTPQQLRDQLVASGLRPSVQRIGILRYVMEHRTHPTAEEIHRALSSEIPSLSLTTVYNTLHILTQAGLVNAIAGHTPDATTHFDSTEHGAHAHFICRECGRIIDVPINRVAEPAPSQGYTLDYIIDEVEIYYRGLCRHCHPQMQVAT